jgi:hypothetical protein
MRNTAVRQAAADIRHPLSEDGGVDECHAPKGAGNVGALTTYGPQWFVLDEGNAAGAERRQRAV